MSGQIDIHSAMAQIGIRYQPVKMDIHSQSANLSIQSAKAQLEIHQTPGNLQIDQTQAFSDEGLKTPLAFSRDESAKATSVANQGVTSDVQWGDKFADLAHGGANVAQYASRNQGHLPQLVPALVPSPFSVHISYQMASLDIHAQLQPVHITADVSPVRQSVQTGSARTYVENPSNLQITSPSFSQLFDVKI